jgi:hypothetical protein
VARALAADDVTIAYHLSYKCPPSTEKAPGSSPENPIALEAFDEAWRAAVDAVEDAADGGKGGGISSYECKWVKLSGFFRWTDYYDYRGWLYRSANGYYFDRDVSYLIEDFADPAARRSELQATQIDIVGQFYQLCAHAPGADMIFGPCHYGGHQGMMLNDVRVLSIAGDRFQILTGEANRAIADDLVEVPPAWSERAEVEQSARYWLEVVAGGRAAYERANAERLAKMDDKERAAVFAPDSWLAALLDNRNPKSALNRVDRLPSKIFFERIEENQKEPDFWVTACVCLDGDCRDRWPLFKADAIRLKDRFLCLELEKDHLAKAAPLWRWPE